MDTGGGPESMLAMGPQLDIEEDKGVLLSVVVPVYKEEQSIDAFLKRLEPIVSALGPYEVIFVLDPSPDRTEEIIREHAQRDARVGLMVMSRRFGQPAATMAGILNCRGRWCVVIDVDLQDPPELIPKLYEMALSENLDVVAAQRVNREGETLVKRAVAALGYQFINSVANVRIPRNTGDFRLMSRRVIEELRGLSEAHGFLRGLVSLVGFPQGELQYNRDPRAAGRSHYNRYWGSLKIAFNGVFGFSTFPLQFMMWLGLSLAILSALSILVVIALKIAYGDEYPIGIPTVTVLVLFIGGVQLAAIGVLGEYIGRIYEEVRRRPMFIVSHGLNVAVRDARGARSGPGATREKP